MGTRHLIAVQLDGKYPIAQYGQWDGYPSGQGADVLDFLRTKMNREVFMEKLRKMTYQVTNEDVDKMYKQHNITLRDGWIDCGDADRFAKFYPSLSRDTGSDILNFVQMATDPVPMRDSLSFAGDGLFCEWAWVIDLDKNTFEAYEGFRKDSFDPEGRFAKFRDKDSEYYPVQLVKTYSLSELPSRVAFLAELEPQE